MRPTPQISTVGEHRFLLVATVRSHSSARHAMEALYRLGLARPVPLASLVGQFVLLSPGRSPVVAVISDVGERVLHVVRDDFDPQAARERDQHDFVSRMLRRDPTEGDVATSPS